ncbi:MAG: hypothetical protein CJBNEKGG_02164 [Prosthecobacter sp.]|nr:hypothetical protein [Prosthecobacter sp.]
MKGPPSAGGVVEDVIDGAHDGAHIVNSAANFIDGVSSVGFRDQFDDQNGHIGLTAGLNPRWITGMRHEAIGYGRPRGMKFGPFFVDSLNVGSGVMYSDYDGTPFRSTKFRPSDDPWSAIVWTNFRLSAYVTNKFALSVRPFIYWLPLENKVGFSGASGLFGLRTGFFPNAMLNSAYRTNIGPTWEFSLQERFHALMAQRTILSEPLMFSASLQDLSSYDTAGRYAFGGFAPPMINSRYQDRIGLNDQLFDEDRVLFRNSALARLRGRVAENLEANIFYGRYDLWNSDFDHQSGWNTAGALLVHGTPLIEKYLGYFVSSRDQTDSLLQWVYAGMQARIGPNMMAFANGGYMWRDGGDNAFSRDSWIGRAGLEQRLGPNLIHGVAFGRAVTDPEFGSRYLADFARYYLALDLSSRLQFRLFYQRTDAERLDSLTASDYKSEVYGALLSMILSPTDTLTVLNSHETYDRLGGQAGWDMWSHRLSYIHQMREDMDMQMYYQYQHGDNNAAGSEPFSEHLLYFGMIKRF